MATLDTNFKLLTKLIGKKISMKEFEQILFDLGMDIDECEGDNLKIDITAERPDLLSAQGLARAIRAYLGLGNPEYTAKKPLKDYKVIIDKSVSCVRPYTACAIVKNLKLNEEKIEEIIWVQEKLHATYGRDRKKAAIGIYPMEHIKLPIYFKADDPKNIKFQPLESDREMNGLQILSQHETGKKYAHLLEGMKKFPYFIDDKGDILSMPPIINSNKTGRVNSQTKDIFIECSGHDFNALSHTLNMIVCMLKDMGGEIYEMELQYDHGEKGKIKTPLLQSEKRKISVDYINKIIGSDFNAKQCADCLKKMMHDVTKVGKDTIEFSVPSIRTDIWHDIDIVDDILRGYGVNNLTPIEPVVATTGGTTFDNILKKQLIELMIGLGFQEIFTLGLTSTEEQHQKMRLEEDEVDESKFIKLGYSAEQNINMVREWLLPEALKALVNNRNRKFPQKIFEINYVVRGHQPSDVLCENRLAMSCLIADDPADFTHIKQVIVYLLECLGFSEKDYEFVKTDYRFFITGRSAEIRIKGKYLGFIGELCPYVLENFELGMPVSGFDIDLDALIEILKEEK